MGTLLCTEGREDLVHFLELEVRLVRGGLERVGDAIVNKSRVDRGALWHTRTLSRFAFSVIGSVRLKHFSL